MVLMICGLVSGCTATSALSALGAVNPMKDDKGIDAAVQIGKENTNSETRGLVNAGSNSSQSTNNIDAAVVYQSNNEKDSPWLIVGFAIMTGFFVMNVRSFFKSKQQSINLRRVKDEVRRRSEIIDFEIV
jgi:hypothetical protein